MDRPPGEQHRSAGPGRHDPVQRLNEHHASELLDIARAFAGLPHALAARATGLDDRGLDLAVDTPTGPTTARVEFPDTASGARRRLAFRDLAARAAERVSCGLSSRGRR